MIVSGAFAQCQAIFAQFVGNTLSVTSLLKSSLFNNITSLYILSEPFDGSVWDVPEILAASTTAYVFGTGQITAVPGMLCDI